jgi:tetratricopeptide (TPR) repeat protein
MLARASAPSGEESPSPISNSLIRRGQFQDAVAVAERARKLDPLSVNAQIAVGTAYRAAGQYDRAIAELRRALAMSPGRDRINFQIGVTLLAMGRLDDAIREIEIGARPPSGHNSRHEAYLGYAYAVAGRTQEARAILHELDGHRRDQYVSWYGIAMIHDALGDKALALAAVQRAFEDHAVEFGLMNQYPPFKTIATEPTFLSIMRTVRR